MSILKSLFISRYGGMHLVGQTFQINTFLLIYLGPDKLEMDVINISSYALLEKLKRTCGKAVSNYIVQLILSNCDFQYVLKIYPPALQILIGKGLPSWIPRSLVALISPASLTSRGLETSCFSLSF